MRSNAEEDRADIEKGNFCNGNDGIMEIRARKLESNKKVHLLQKKKVSHTEHFSSCFFVSLSGSNAKEK